MFNRIMAGFVFSILTSSLFAQSNYKKGYAIDLQGDTLKGFINYTERSRTPSSFAFKASLQEKEVMFTANNTSKVVIEGYDMFERFTVSISMNEVDYNKVYPEELPAKKETVFLQVMSKGDRVNLYGYRDILKDRYYILQSPQTTPVELEFEVQKRDNQVVPVETYKVQLQQLATSYSDSKPDLTNLIETASYSPSQIRKIVEKINTINERVSPSGNTIKNGRLVVSAGLNVSSIAYKGTTIINANGLDNNGNPATKDKTTTHSYLPVIHLAYDFFFHPNIQRSYFRTELSIAAFQSKATSTYMFSRSDEVLTNTYDLLGAYVALTPQYVYNVYQQQKLSIYTGAGVSVRYLFYPKQTLFQNTNKQGPGYLNKVFEDYYSMRKVNIVPTVRIGVIVNKKISASVMAFVPSELTATDKTTNISVAENSLQLNLSYFF